MLDSFVSLQEMHFLVFAIALLCLLAITALRNLITASLFLAIEFSVTGVLVFLNNSFFI
jgi:hypothetical protein